MDGRIFIDIPNIFETLNYSTQPRNNNTTGSTVGF
jgi:hypothetical protein